MDDVEAVFEGLEDEEEGLGFGDEGVDFVGDDAGVADVLVEEEGGGEGDGLERREDG
ncbi:MAG: hypothetical protein M1823_008049, partial [Watsoniomyces obsoletus]